MLFRRNHKAGVPRIDPLGRTLGDTPMTTGTKRSLLGRAAVGAAGVAAASVVPASAVAETSKSTTQDVGVFTATTEALTLTLVTELLRRTKMNSDVPKDVSTIFDAIYASELDHWNFISEHYQPATKKFWIPDGFFGGEGDALDLTAVGKGVSGGETLFINTYLVGVTAFAEAGNAKFARYFAEAAGNESEHRLLGQTLAGENPPNNLGFEEYLYDNIIDIGAAAERAGFGFGKQGSAAGRFYEFPEDPMAPPIAITSKKPA